MCVIYTHSHVPWILVLKPQAGRWHGEREGPACESLRGHWLCCLSCVCVRACVCVCVCVCVYRYNCSVAAGTWRRAVVMWNSSLFLSPSRSHSLFLELKTPTDHAGSYGEGGPSQASGHQVSFRVSLSTSHHLEGRYTCQAGIYTYSEFSLFAGMSGISCLAWTTSFPREHVQDVDDNNSKRLQVLVFWAWMVHF